MAAVDDWDAYVQEYELDIANVRAHTQTILNDPTATTAQKENAVRELTIQEIHLQELKAANAEIQETGIVPSTITFGKNNCGSFVFRWNGDSKIHAAMYNPISASGNVRDTDSGVSLGTFLLSDIVTVSAKTAYNYPGDPPYNVTFSEYANTGGTYKEFGIHTAAVIPSAGDVKIKFTSNVLTISDSQFTSSLNTVLIRAQVGDLSNPVTWSDVGTYVIPLNLTYVGLVNTPSETVNGDSPWDYFNNKIKPIVNPANSVFPDGYNPDPEKPDAELPELPGEGENGGPDIEPNDITGIGGGFGFLTQYAIRAQDIEILGKLLWAGFRTGSQQDIDNYLMNFVYNVNADTGSMNFSDIMEFFVSLKMYPFPLANAATLTAHDHHIHVGAGYTAIGDNAALPHFPNIIYTMDSYIGKISAGSVELPFWFRDYRDYSIQITLYLPYCGTVELNPGDVMGGTLECDYYIDFCTGSCTAYVTCTSWDGHRFPVATMPGQIGADVPMSATNAGRIAARIYSDRIDHVENMVGAFKALTTGAGAIMSGNYAGAARQGFGAFIDPAINEEKLKAGMLDRGAIAAPVLSAGGGFTSFCNPTTCYVTYRSPFYPEIGNYPDSVGTPAALQVTIGDCTGFCQFVNVDTSGITTDADAQKQIRDALAAGIYI